MGPREFSTSLKLANSLYGRVWYSSTTPNSVMGGNIKFEGAELTLIESLVQVRSCRTYFDGEFIGGKFKFEGAELTPMKSLA